MSLGSALRRVGVPNALLASLRTIEGHLRSAANSLVIPLKYRPGSAQTADLKLHLGCGARKLDGFLNIDFKSTPATDIVCDVRRLPFPSQSVELIESYHLIEHLGRHDLPPVLANWYRILKPGGRLAIECPDIDEAMSRYLGGDAKMLDSIYGLQRYRGDTHYFGYSFASLKSLLSASGFVNIELQPAQDHHALTEPCIRVVCAKP